MAILTLQQSNATASNFTYAADYKLDISATGWYMLDAASGTIFGAVSGSGISYDAYNTPTLGTITSAKSLNPDGSARWTISGLAIAANSYSYIQSTLRDGDTFDYYMTNTLLNGNDTITGSSGDDIISYSAGSDVINGGTGIDWMSFSTSNYSNKVTADLSLNKYTVQTLSGSTVSSITGIENLIGSDFDDALTGDSGNNIFIGGKGNDTINGGAGIDTVSYAKATGTNISLATGLASEMYDFYYQHTDTLSNIENVIGSAFDDNITGNSSNNVLTGGTGNDTLDGGLGLDMVNFSTSYKSINVNLSTGVAIGQGTDKLLNIESATGSNYADTLTGNSGSNILLGGAGNDSLNGGAGNDNLNGGADIDWAYYTSATSAVTVNLALTTAQITGGAGTDTLTSIENLLGSKYNDTFTGNSLANTLDGGTGLDRLNGSSGNDVLIGGAGKDSLTGGTGYDTFKFNATTETAVGTYRDVINDFLRGTDKIDLSLIDANVFLTGNQAFTLIASTSAFSAAGQIKFASGILSGEVTGDGNADFEIALTGITAVAATDFIL